MPMGFSAQWSCCAGRNKWLFCGQCAGEGWCWANQWMCLGQVWDKWSLDLNRGDRSTIALVPFFLPMPASPSLWLGRTSYCFLCPSDHWRWWSPPGRGLCCLSWHTGAAPISVYLPDVPADHLAPPLTLLRCVQLWAPRRLTEINKNQIENKVGWFLGWKIAFFFFLDEVLHKGWHYLRWHLLQIRPQSISSLGLTIFDLSKKPQTKQSRNDGFGFHFVCCEKQINRTNIFLSF